MNINVGKKPTFAQIIDSKHIVKVVRYRGVQFSIYTCLISVTIGIIITGTFSVRTQLAFYNILLQHFLDTFRNIMKMDNVKNTTKTQIRR